MPAIIFCLQCSRAAHYPRSDQLYAFDIVQVCAYHSALLTRHFSVLSILLQQHEDCFIVGLVLGPGMSRQMQFHHSIIRFVCLGQRHLGVTLLFACLQNKIYMNHPAFRVNQKYKLNNINNDLIKTKKIKRSNHQTIKQN